jgi:hypothetical protein
VCGHVAVMPAPEQNPVGGGSLGRWARSTGGVGRGVVLHSGFDGLERVEADPSLSGGDQ